MTADMYALAEKSHLSMDKVFPRLDNNGFQSHVWNKTRSADATPRLHTNDATCDTRSLLVEETAI